MKPPRLQSILLLANIFILLLPLGGIAVFRIYESEIIKQTEASLIGQGALVAAGYKQEILRRIGIENKNGRPFSPSSYGRILPRQSDEKMDGVYGVVPPRLDMAVDPILPPGKDAVPPEIKPDSIAAAAGKAVLPLINSSKRITLTGTRVVDYRGTVVASSGSESGMSLLVREETPRALRGENVSLLRVRTPESSVGRTSRVRVFVAMPIIHGDRVWGAVILSRTPLNTNNALYLIRWRLVKGGLIMAALLVLMTALTTLMISRPVKELIKQANQAATGEKSVKPLSSPRTREVADLSRAIAQMAENLSRRAEQMRTFADHVSHGFKTPLTSLSAAIELLQDPDVPMEPGERKRFLEMMDSDISRLERLVKKLIDLARADSMQPLDAASDVRKAVDDLAEKYAFENRPVFVDHKGERFTAAMAPEILESVLINLLDNSWKHGGDNIQAALATDYVESDDGGVVVITVCDNGKGISQANAEKIFSPFFTTAGQKGGSGMGLAIVRSLVESHGGSIELAQPGDGDGACFEIRLKTAESA